MDNHRCEQPGHHNTTSNVAFTLHNESFHQKQQKLTTPHTATKTVRHLTPHSNTTTPQVHTNRNTFDTYTQQLTQRNQKCSLSRYLATHNRQNPQIHPESTKIPPPTNQQTFPTSLHNPNNP